MDDVDRVFQDLKAKGNELRGKGPRSSPFGHQTLSIEPPSPHGIYFQLAGGEELSKEADLTGALDVTEEQLAEAESLEAVTMPDGTIYKTPMSVK